MGRVSIMALVDELGALSEPLAEARRLERRADEIKVILREHVKAKNPPASRSVNVRGREYVATVGALPPIRVLRVTVAQLFKTLGLKRFLGVVSVTIKALEENLEPEELEGLIRHGHASTRPVTIQPR